MRRLRFVALALCVLVVAGLVAAGSAHPALAVGSQIRAFVATTGSDANPCTRTAPCRTFGAALAQTASGGEIVALDSGGYGTVEIYQAVTIVAAPGVQASISPSSGAAILVQAGPTDTVVLRNLQLNGLGAYYGVQYVTAGSLHIENLTISGFGVYGIFMGVYGAADLYVTDTVVRRNTVGGMYLYSTTGAARATIVNTRAERNGGYGFLAAENVAAYVRNSTSSGNVYGFGAYSYNGTAVEMDLEGCVADGNSSYGIFAGVSAGGSGVVRASNCTVTGNFWGVYNATSNSSTLSRGNNTVEGNGNNGSFSGTYAAK